MRKKYFSQFVLFWVIFIIALFVNLPISNGFKIGNWQKDLKLHKGLDLVGGTQLVYELKTEGYAGSQDEATSRASEVIRLRVDALGVAEPVIQSTKINGNAAILVELPGIDDTDLARDIIGQTAQLLFMTTDGEVVLTGNEVVDASPTFDQTTNQPNVRLELNAEGGEAFAKATEANIGQPIFILLDNQIISNPVVQEKIPNGVATITIGEQNRTEAVKTVNQLTTQINSGALPVPMELVEERTVGASLGQESVRQSIFAGIVGFTGLLLFMIVVYGLSGLVAVLSLILYTFIMFFFIQLIPITLTLAGIAGIILTLGVTVDANILTFERMKEEVREGKDMSFAVKEGAKRAWSSIRDANYSSLITAVILFYFGTGPIKGFALILIVGVLVGIFSAIYMTRILLNFLLMTRFKDKLIK